MAAYDRYGIPLVTVICKKCGWVLCQPLFKDTTSKNNFSNQYLAIIKKLTDFEKTYQKIKNGKN